MSKVELDSETVARLEASIFAARDYVAPSSDLRPRTLEQARHSSRVQNWANRATVLGLSIMALWISLTPLLRVVSRYRDNLKGPFPAEIEQAAQNYSEGHRYEAAWGTVEAFREVRKIHRSDSALHSAE